MAKIKLAEGGNFWFMCPGCDRPIMINRTWHFNDNLDNPTITPSILSKSRDENGPTVCHSFITDGKIKFLDDCTHSLKGQTVELPEIDLNLF